jgi:subfamily B ATP-binding cassette protein MsbA
LDNSSYDQILEAARRAHAIEFIERLPDGLDTRLGDNGAGLSGGQRQRLAIARALLKQAPVLILDEATSALDGESERAVQEALESGQSQRATLVIAHRLSTIERADRIILLDKGEILAQGSHEQLLQSSALYAAMYRQGSAESD